MKTFFIMLAIFFVLVRVITQLGKKGASTKSSTSRRPGVPKLPKLRRSRPPERPTPMPPPRPPTPPRLPRARPTEALEPAPPRPVRLPPRPEGTSSADYYLDVVRVGDPDATADAARRLVAMGPEALPALQEALRDPTPFVRDVAQRVVDAIGHAADQAAEAEEEIEFEPAPRPGPVTERAQRASESVSERGSERVSERVPERFPERAPTVDREAPEARWTPPVVHEPEQAPVTDVEPVAQAGPETESATASPSAADDLEGEALTSRLATVASATRFDEARKEALKELRARVACFELIVERVQWTGAFGASKPYLKGRTVAGRMPGDGPPVAIRLMPERNEEADAWPEGHRLTFRGRLQNWDDVYDRGVFEGEST